MTTGREVEPEAAIDPKRAGAARSGGRRLRRKLCLVGIDGVSIHVACQEWVAPTLLDLAGFPSDLGSDSASVASLGAAADSGTGDSPGSADDLSTGSLGPAGSMGTVWMETPTLSGPGWSTLLTGATHAEHGVTSNEFVGHRLQYYPDLLSQVWFADHTARTFAVVAWAPLVDPHGPGPVIHSRIDQQRRDQHRIGIRSAIPYGAAAADREIATIGSRLLAAEGADASFIYFESVDEAGHLHGGASEEYRTAISIVDGYLRPIIGAIDLRRAADPTEDWILAVTTDHGHTPLGGAHGHGGASEVERRSFLAVRYFGMPGEPVPHEMAAADVTPFLLRQVI